MSSLLNMFKGNSNSNSNSDSNSSQSSASSSSMSSGSLGSSTTASGTTGYNNNTHTQGYSNSGYGTSGAGTGTATGIAGHHQQQGYQQGSAAQTTNTTAGSTGTAGNDQYITRSEEQLRVGKEAFETGRAQLGKHVTTENVSTSVPISKERVVVEREPITSKDIQAGNLRGDIGEASYEMRLKEERAVAEKEVVPIEKVRMRKEVETTQQEVGGELRKEHIDFNDGMSGNAGAYGNTGTYQKTDTTGTTGMTGGMPTTTGTGYGATNTGSGYNSNTQKTSTY